MNNFGEKGLIPAQKVGKHWRFRKAAIDRWLESTGGPADEKGDPR